MKVYYLRLIESDFTKTGNVWTSGTIDLFDNASYRNYSTTKSGYGLNSLGNQTWTGLESTGLNTTDSGIISSGRFIDTTGRIDLKSYTVTYGNTPGSDVVGTTLDIYTAHASDALFPIEWASIFDVEQTTPLILINSFRYLKLALKMNTQMDMSSATLEFLLRIEIDSPVMAPLYSRTKNVLNKFPEWMALRELDNTVGATPTSLGGQLINSVAGEWLTDLTAEVIGVRAQQFISTTDTSQLCWVYESADVSDQIWCITGDSVSLARVGTLSEFYELTDSEDAFYWNESSKTIYTRKPYSSLLVNHITTNQSPIHIWNWFDEFGILMDLERLYLESNESFKARILDTYVNKPGVGLEAFKLALRRELNLWTAFGATPDSSFPGATPEVLEIKDIENDVHGATPYMGYDDVPSDRFFSLVDDLAKKYPTTWGYFKWNQAHYDMGGPENQGYESLAYRYDATPLDNAHTQSGVGDGDDLFLFKPQELKGPQEFTVKLKARGLQKSLRNEYRKVKLDVDFWGRADKKIYSNPATTSWLTLKVVDNHATPNTYYHSFQLTATSDVSPVNASNTVNSFATYQVWNNAGNLLNGLTFYDVSGNAHSTDDATPFSLGILNVSSAQLHYGKWDTLSSTYTNVPSGLTSRAWFSNNSSSKLNSNAGSYLSSSIPPIGYMVYESLATSYVVGKWESEKQRLNIEINGTLPDQSVSPMTIAAPNVHWDPNLEVVPNKEYLVQIITQNQSSVYGGFTKDISDQDLFIEDTHITLNSSSSWTVGEQSLSVGTTQLTFATSGSIPSYPVVAPVWNLFESLAISGISGVVDENGPWHNGVPSVPGNTNYNLTQATLSRDTFGIPNTTDYSITWIGIDVEDNPNVIAWLDTNTVNPAIKTGVDVTYPNSAIVETLNDMTSVYDFSPFIVRAKFRPGVNARWNPRLNSGWFYDKNKEYYSYADKKIEYTSLATPLLSSVSRQGAPIIVYSDATPNQEFRQVSFYDAATPSLTLINTEHLSGSGEYKLYLSYEDIYDVEVTDETTGLPIVADTSSSTHVISTSSLTDRTHTYMATYKLKQSFYADNEYVHTDGSQRTKLTFDKSPSNFGASQYTITYEGSIYETATPIDLPLNTFYTTQDEGFVFLSFDEYTLTTVECRISPSKIVADGQDYLLLTIRSLDEFGNAKPFQTFSISSNWGTLDASSLTTDNDGFAVATLTAASSTSSLSGTITIGGPVNTTVTFEIEPLTPKKYRIVSVPSADRIPADGNSKVYVYGSIEDGSYAPVPYARIAYRRARSMHDLFTSSYQGQVVADSSGKFSIGPFTAATPGSPGYWLLSTESWNASATPYIPATPDYSGQATPSYGPVGDVVFWHEYPDVRHSIEDMTGLPLSTLVPISPEYSNEHAFPVNYDNATPHDAATPVTITWEPPSWYAIPKYDQYQLGFFGNNFYSVDFDKIDDGHPDYKDI